jgi:site-specific DNA-methyltransferase (adenine-specific)
VKPYYEHAGITIYHGDCREILSDVTADVLLTDPPYGIGFKYEESYIDSPSEYGAWIWPAIELAETRLSRHGVAAIFQSAKYCRSWQDWFPRDFRLFAIPKVFVQMNTALVTWATDYVLFWPMPEAPKGRQAWQPAPARDWFVSHESAIPRTGPEKEHPCPRPMDMMTYLTSVFSEPGSMLLDPFMGSGTTLRAAKDLGRRAIGIEIEEKYCEIAARRLSQEVFDFSGSEIK